MRLGGQLGKGLGDRVTSGVTGPEGGAPGQVILCSGKEGGRETSLSLLPPAATSTRSCSEMDQGSGLGRPR